MSTYSNSACTSHSGPIRTLEGAAPISEAMERMRSMIERHAPMLMKVGGWSGGAPTPYKVGRRQLTPAQRKHLLERAKEGVSFGVIGREMGISDSTVGRIARNNGIVRGCKGNGGAFNLKVPTYQIK